MLSFLTKQSKKDNKVKSASNIDDFLLRLQVITVISGNYVIFRVFLMRQQSFITFKIRIATFKKFFHLLSNVNKSLAKEQTNGTTN